MSIRLRDPSQRHGIRDSLLAATDSHTLTPDATTGLIHDGFKQKHTSTEAFSVNDTRIRPPPFLDRALRCQYWNPLWLQKYSLLAIAVLFGLLTAVLIILWHFSGMDGGFTLLTTNHYAWTYGPTAILVIIVSIWRQVDFWCKSLTPWQVLKTGNAASAESMLLDYISPLQTTSIWRALRNGHLSVVATIFGFVLLKLITVASTGLLVLLPSQRSFFNETLLATSKFNSTRYQATLGTYDDLTNAGVVYNAYALLAENIPYPDGISKDSVYQTFTTTGSSGSRTNLTITAEVDAFYPYLDCEPANATLFLPPFNTTEMQYSATLNVTWSSCKTSEHQPYTTSVTIKDPRYDSCPPRQLNGELGIIFCSSGPTFDDSEWYLLTLTDIRYNQTLANGSVAAPDLQVKTTSWGIEVMPVAAVVCKPGYGIERARVTYAYAQNPPITTVTGPLTRSGRTLQGFYQYNLTSEVIAALFDAVTAFGDIVSEDLALELPNTFFKMMSEVVHANYEALLNETTLAKAAPEVYKSLANQIAKTWIVMPSTDPLEGQVKFLEDRLWIAAIPLWIMTGAFIAMMIIVVIVASSRPVGVVPCNTESIGSVSLILAQSDNIQDILSAAGGIDFGMLRDTMSNYKFRSFVKSSDNEIPRFALHASSSGATAEAKVHSRKIQWWHPLASSKTVICLTLSLPICLIITLEVLQRLSDRWNGIAPITSSGNLFSILLTRFLPALIMLVVATLYNSLDFAMSMLAPFHSLCTGQRVATRSIRSTLLGKTPLHAIYHSVRHAHHGATFSAIAALLGSTLTIIVSGLYTIHDVPLPRSIDINRMDHFNINWINSVTNDNQATILASLIESSVIPYPEFTFAELAFPRIEVSNSSSQVLVDLGDRGSSMSVQLPALRASLNCSIVPMNSYNFTTGYSIETGTQAFVAAIAPLPANCLLGGQWGNLSFIEWGNEFPGGGNNTDRSSYVGQVLDLHVGPWNESWDSSWDEDNIMADNPQGCPSLAFTFGYFGWNETGYLETSKSNITTMMCYQLMQQLDVNVNISLPDLSISTSSPPIPDESTIRYLSAGRSGMDTLEYRIEKHLETQLSVFDQDQYTSTTDQMADNTVYPFYQAVLLGKDPVHPSLLTGPENQERLINATQAFYRRYMAQVISANMRVRNDGSTSSETFIGTYIDPTNPRVFQSNASKLTLQVVLGIMIICATLAYSLTSMSKTLPHNPCSIAGTASLLAGSEMCSERLSPLLPDGAEWMTDKELDEHKVWNGWLFSMGLWDWKFGEQRRFGIDVGAADKAD
jgi:Protein of unknown function (DUF3433)